jgi:threonylcarbamoyladenosine tRNA methylthiotransferase MtaB
MHGFTDNYIKIKTPYNPLLINQLKECTLKELDADGSVLVDVLITEPADSIV